MNDTNSSKKDFFRSAIEQRYDENLKLERPLRVQLGVDFGTSYSKVAWRLNETCFPLCFGKRQNVLDDYLVPSAIAFDGNTFVTGIDFAQANGAVPENQITNFKICVACECQKSSCNVRNCRLTKWDCEKFAPEAQQKEAFFAAAFYLSKLIAQSKKNIKIELEKKGFNKSVPVKWLITTAVPERFSEQSGVMQTYQKILRVACLMAEAFADSQPIDSRADVFSLFNAALELESTRIKMDCFTYPEVAAQVASVTMSRTSEEGLYAYVDIGAGTIDASVFRFSRVAETPLSTYAASVFKLGAANIEAEAAKSLPHLSLRQIKELKEKHINQLDALLKEEDINEALEEVLLALKQAANSMRGQSKGSLTSLLKMAYDKEPFEYEWKNIKLILGGGGSGINMYKNAANSAFSSNNVRFVKSVLPLPGDFQLQGLPSSHFHRFAVAYGVSFPFIKLPEVATSNQVKPLTKKYRFEIKKPINKKWV